VRGILLSPCGCGAGSAPSGSRFAGPCGNLSSGVVSAAAVPSVCPTPRERRPRDSAHSNPGPHEPAERGGLLLCHTLAQPLVGLAPVIATSATPVVEVVLDAAANPAVVGKHGAAVGGEPVRRPIGGRARTSAIRLLLDFAGGSGIAAIRLDRMSGRRAARNAENAEREPATYQKPAAGVAAHSQGRTHTGRKPTCSSEGEVGSTERHKGEQGERGGRWKRLTVRTRRLPTV
jgi:hypothetical protein